MFRCFLRNFNTPAIRRFTTGTKMLTVMPPKRDKPITRRGPVTWRSAGITAAIGAGLVGFMVYVKNEKDTAIAKERKRQLGKASIGGEFELIDSEVIH